MPAASICGPSAAGLQAAGYTNTLLFPKGSLGWRNKVDLYLSRIGKDRKNGH